MEFGEKLQELRKQRGLTQEELAQALFVSRTAVSKWESGRGYPSIDSLKVLSAFFAITIDDLLSGDELLTLAGEDHRRQTRQSRDLLFGLLDCCMALLLFLPFFGQETDTGVQAVSLLTLDGVSAWLKAVCLIAVAAMTGWGVLTLALQNLRHDRWEQQKHRISLALSAAGTLLFILCRQPYAAVFCFIFLGIKAFMLLKRP